MKPFNKTFDIASIWPSYLAIFILIVVLLKIYVLPEIVNVLEQNTWALLALVSVVLNLFLIIVLVIYKIKTYKTRGND